MARNWHFQALTILIFLQCTLQRTLEEAGIVETCGPNEVMEKCGGFDTYCNVGPPPFDHYGCPMPACVCAEGHARERNGTCVRVVDCAAPCGPNEYLPRDCESMFIWGGTCEQPDVMHTLDCRWPPTKCLCIEKYVRHNGSCIPQEACPDGADGRSEIAPGRHDRFPLTPLFFRRRDEYRRTVPLP